MNSNRKFFVQTFGCQMNFADSDEMSRHLFKRGFVKTEDQAQADTVVVNTCTVRELAEQKALSFIGRLREWKTLHPQGMIIVTGCAAERAKADIKRRFPYIDLIVGAKDIEAFPQELDARLADSSATEPTLSAPSPSKPEESLKIAEESLIPDDFSPGSTSPVVNYVTIMRGCNYNCTYCIVPSVRGREIYRSPEEIAKDVRDRTQEGAREIWLLGQTVNSYRYREGYDFSHLLKDVASVESVARLRFMSPHPFYLTPQLIRALAEIEKVCEHIHLPVQSGSNAVLQRMKRNYTKESYLKGLKELRAAIPTIAITTDIIVGFPGESETDFRETLELVKEADFDSAYCFKYSPRPGTPAAAWPDDIPTPVKEERINALLDVTESQGIQKAQNLVDTVQEVLIEDDKGNGVMRGKTRGAWRVRFKNVRLKQGDIIKARIIGSHSRELWGEPLPR